MNTEARSLLLRYGGAVAAIVVATLARLLADPWLEERIPFLTLILAVLIAARLGGLGPGLLALGLGGMAAAQFFILPDDVFFPHTAFGWAKWGFYWFVGAATALTGWRLRVLSERAKQSQALANAVFDTSLDCIIIIDHCGSIVEFNAAAEKTFGYRRSDVLGKPMAEFLIPPALRQKHYEGLKKYFDTSEGPVLGQRIEMPALRANGEEFPVKLSIARIPGAGPPMFSAHVRDITERKRAERRRNARLAITQILAESGPLTEVFGRILEAIGEAMDWDVGAVWAWDQGAQSLRCARVWQRASHPCPHFVPATREHTFPSGVGLPGRVWSDRRSCWVANIVEDANFPRASFAREDGLHGAFGFPIVLGDETLGVIEFFSHEIRQPDDDLLEMTDTLGGQIGQFLDRRRAEQARDESERLHRAIGESIDYGVWVCDPDGRNIYASESFLNLVGLTQQECSDFGWGDVLHPDDAAETIAAWRDCVRTMGVWDREHRFRGVDGKFHPVLARGVPVKDDQGRIVCWAGINLDISRLKEVEEALREADQRKTEFLAMLAHELRNPLAPIRSGLDVLALETGGANETVRLMQEQVDHLVRLVDDLLDVSRIIRGKVELRRQAVDLSAVVRRAVQAVRPTMQSRQQEIVVSTPREPLWLDADPVRLVQVTENLLNNASKYSDSQTRIDLQVERDGEEAVLRVRDQGIGMESELLPKVFELFTQSAHSLDRAQGGLGIGLTLVRDLVAMHGGVVAAQSEGPGQGSEFVVRLPLRKEAPSSEPAPSPQAETAAGRRILIVDDNIAAAKTLSLLLTGLGRHRVEIAHDGPAALAKAQNLRPEIVLLDIGMPGMNGYEVCRALRAMPSVHGALLVAVTGYGQEDDRRRTQEAGFDGHLVKPPARCDMERLLSDPKLARQTSAGDDAESGEAIGRTPAAPSRTSQEVPSGETLPPIEYRIGDFLRELTHEVGNAVHPLQLMLQVLEYAGANPAMHDRLRQALVSQLPAMDRMVQHLRRVSRVIRGAFEPHPMKLDLAPVVRAAAEAVRPLLEQHDQQLELHLAASLPPLHADPDLLEQALKELLTNSAHHAGRGGQVTLTADMDERHLRLRVRDAGEGISPALLPHLFEPFVRGEEEPDFRTGRFGLGLALVKQIAEKHRGAVTAFSAGPGQGSEFTLRLPLSVYSSRSA